MRLEYKDGCNSTSIETDLFLNGLMSNYNRCKDHNYKLTCYFKDAVTKQLKIASRILKELSGINSTMRNRNTPVRIPMDPLFDYCEWCTIDDICNKLDSFSYARKDREVIASYLFIIHEAISYIVSFFTEDIYDNCRTGIEQVHLIRKADSTYKLNIAYLNNTGRKISRIFLRDIDLPLTMLPILLATHTGERLVDVGYGEVNFGLSSETIIQEKTEEMSIDDVIKIAEDKLGYKIKVVLEKKK